MPKLSRQHDKSSKKNYRECILQLKSMIESSGITTKHRNSLSCAEDSKSQTSMDSENSLNIEVRNVWGQKDLQSILKDRNDRIYMLESELEDLKAQNARLSNDRKRAKIESVAQNSVETLEKLVAEKNIQIAKAFTELDEFRERIKLLESQLRAEKDASETLKDANKRLADISNKKMSPVCNKDSLVDSQRLVELEQELSRTKSINVDLEKDLQEFRIQSKIIEDKLLELKTQLSTQENRTIHGEFRKVLENSTNITLGDVENSLIEELESVTAAYDQITLTNKALEQNCADLLKKQSELHMENITLRNKAKIYEDAKQYIEKEKRRLDEWRNTLATETRLFEDRVANYTAQLCDKDRKIAEYKTVLITYQSNIKLLENELGSVTPAFKTAQEELAELRNAFKTLKIEYADTKRLAEAYRNMCTDEVDVVEDLERCKRVLKCSLCDTNMKNCVITKCMHTFCESCLNDRLKARQRKCPNCQIEFSSTDMKRIYF